MGEEGDAVVNARPVAPKPYWGMCHNGAVMHLVGEQVGSDLTLFFARCRPQNPDDGYTLDTFPTIHGIRAMQEWDLVCRKCEAIYKGRMPAHRARPNR